MYWSEVREFFTWSGVRLMVEGRMASWPSWAPARDLKCRGLLGRYFFPQRFSIYSPASRMASSEMRRESVRI